MCCMLRMIWFLIPCKRTLWFKTCLWVCCISILTLPITLLLLSVFERWNFLHDVSSAILTESYTKEPSTVVTESQRRFLRKLTIICGTQKGGTTSLIDTLAEIDGVYAYWKETHLFDKKLRLHLNDLDSFNIAIRSFYNNTDGITGYIDTLKSAAKNKNRTDRTIDAFAEKTPGNMIYPHAAYILASDFVKYGTKLILLLRDPTKRFISSYFQEYKTYGDLYQKNDLQYLWNDGIDGYLKNVVVNESRNGDHSFIRFSNDLNDLLNEYKDMKATKRPKEGESVLNEMVYRYREFIYFYTAKYNQLQMDHPLWIYYLIWIRGCYAPQVMTMQYYVRKLNPDRKFIHSLKVIQSERYYDAKTFHFVMTKLLCYVRYDGDIEFDKWMSECVQEDRFGGQLIAEIKTNSKTRDFVPSQEQLTLISSSFDVCNEWLRVLVDEMYPDITLDEFDWTFWELNA